jgi:DNA-binding transcriptional regulator YdaS (Cro superfamily)
MLYEHSMRDEALQRAIQSAGTGADLARQLRVTPQALSQWRRVPPLRVIDVERATGVPRYELRPDVYPAPQTEATE